MAGQIATAQRTDWCTPARIIDPVHEFFEGPPELDPCSNANSIVRARNSISLPDNGLEVNWTNYRTVYVNPPYGRGIGKWISKCVSSDEPNCEILLLIPAATDTRHWHLAISSVLRFCLIRGRLRFLGAPASAPFPSALLYWGPTYRANRFESIFSSLGNIYTLMTVHK